MGYIVHILLALASLAAPDLGWGGALSPAWAMPLLLLGPHALGRVVRWFLLRGRFRRGAILERVLGLSPVLIQAAAVGMGWLAVVERWTGWATGLDGWPGLALLAGLAPFIAAELLAIDARARLLDPGRDARRAVRSFQARLFLSAFLPFLLYLGVSSLIGLHEPLRVHLEEVSLHGAVFSTLLLIVLVSGLPFFLRNTWDTMPLEPGRLREILEDLARRARFRCRELLVWRTGNQMANAAIIGFTAGSRIVLFSDALLARLAPREVAAVFAHEIGHAKHRHAIVFGSWALAFFLGADRLLTWFGVEDDATAIGIFAAVMFVWYLWFGFLSRRFELEADLTSFELMGDSASLVGALRKVSGAHAHDRSTWRHFGITDRVAFLERARDPAVGRALRRRLRLARRTGFVLFVVVAALQLHGLWSARTEEHLVAELRLGRYDAAAARLDEGDEINERLAALVELAASLPETERAPAMLESLARAAFESGDPQRAVDLLELAWRRGRDDLASVLAAVAALAGPEPVELDLEGLPAPWRQTLAQ